MKIVLNDNSNSTQSLIKQYLSPCIRARKCRNMSRYPRTRFPELYSSSSKEEQDNDNEIEGKKVTAANGTSGKKYIIHYHLHP